MTTPVEEAIARFLPWAGGMAGLTILYFIGVLIYQHRQEQRLKKIETLLYTMKGMLLTWRKK